MKILMMITAALTLAACAGPTAKMTDKEICIGTVKAKSVNEALSYAEAVHGRSINCDLHTQDLKLTDEENKNLQNITNELMKKFGHLAK
jgi:hypothetical protein